MIYQSPWLQGQDRAVLELISEQRDRLKIYTQNSPKRWFGSLRRSTFARAIQGSNSIEGYHASIDEAIAVVADEPPLDERTETWLAIKGYREALTYITQASQDRYFEFSKQFLKSLHFMMIGFDMSKYPGQWRPGGVWVANERTGKTVYEGPPVELVNDLVEELVDYLKAPVDNEPVIARAGMAHLNLTMIHPFKDGNGRMARALQTFVLAREGILHPVFSSIEEWLGRNTDAYYAILAEIGQGIWNPTRDALPWIRFCLRAHYQQAATLIRRNEEYSLLYEELTELAHGLDIPERSTLPLFDAALGFRLTNARYRNDAEVSEVVASRDLKRLSDLGLLEPIGEKRGRFYKATDKLHKIRREARIAKADDLDPYEVIAARHPRLPGV
ncbi:MAG TPA: Fic family protein [Alphaproteobacteria bacterium]|nr:Fic family protein [Alphaproteobacteria bacterium]